MSPQRKVNFLCDMRSVHCLFTGNEHYWTHERDDEGCALDFTVHVSGRFLLATCTRFLRKFWNAFGLFFYFYLLFKKIESWRQLCFCQTLDHNNGQDRKSSNFRTKPLNSFFSSQWRSMPLVWRYIHRLSPQYLLYFKLFLVGICVLVEVRRWFATCVCTLGSKSTIFRSRWRLRGMSVFWKGAYNKTKCGPQVHHTTQVCCSPWS